MESSLQKLPDTESRYAAGFDDALTQDKELSAQLTALDSDELAAARSEIRPAKWKMPQAASKRPTVPSMNTKLCDRPRTILLP